KKALSEDRANDRAEAKSKVGQRARRRDALCHELWIQGRRKGSELVSRYTIRREEEIGKRLSDAPYMYSTNSVVNANTFMSAMRSRRGAMALNQKWRRWKRERSHLWERKR